MAEDLFDADEPFAEESDDSFIAPSEPESEASLGSRKAAEEAGDSDYEFLFGSDAKPELKQKKKSASKWQKELDRRMREAHAQYADIDNIEQDIMFRLKQLSEHFERRHGVESEMLTLFSGLLTREQFTVDAAPPSKNAPVSEESTDVPPPEQGADKAMEKLMKKLIRQTFRGRTPEGRFGNLGRAAEETNRASAPSKVSTVVTISRDALSNLQDLNTLLSREREGDYVELDGVPLYKHTRYGTLYIFDSGLVTTHILPLCTKLMQESSSPEHDYSAITQEVIYLLYQLSQPPSGAWYNYWKEAQPHYRALAVSKEYEHQSSVASELKRRSGILGHYMHGLVALRAALQSSDLWTLVGEFRLKLENFKRAGHRTPQQQQHVEMLRERQNTLANERDALLAEAEDSDDDNGDQAPRGRLRKDHSAAGDRKKRVQEIRNQLYEVNEELSNERQAHMDAEQQTRVHCKTIRLLITQLLTAPGDGLSLLCMLQESGLINLLRDEVLACFEQCKQGFVVSEEGEISTHPAYISEAQRENLWEYVRLIHALLVCIDLGRFLGAAHEGVRLEEVQANEFLIQSGDGSQLQTVNNESLIDLIRLNPKLARMHLRGQVNWSKFVINERFSGTRSRESYEHWFRLPSLAHLQTPFDISSGVFANGNSGGKGAIPLSVNAVKSLQSELHKLIGIDGEFEHCHWSDEDGAAAVYYELGLVLSLCFSDLLREAQDRYFQPTDYEVVLDLHTWVVTYYRCLHAYVRAECRTEDRQPPPEAYVLLALRRYVGGDSLCAKVSCAYVWQLIRKHSLSKATHFGATSALRVLYANLALFNMLGDVHENFHMTRICQESLSSYFAGNVRALLFWILRQFKPLSHPPNLFCFALSNLHLLRRVVHSVGSVSFTIETTSSDAMGFDSDTDVSDDGTSTTKTIVVTKDSVFSSRNRNTANDDILYNGRVVYNCISMLANFRTNSSHLNDMLVSHLEAVPLPMLYDVKYFYVFGEIASDRRVWKNARWRWVGDFCVRVMESFFDSWMGRGNRFLPAELFFNKCSPAIRGPFRPCAREHIMPLVRGYDHCELLNELLKRPDASVYELSKELRGDGSYGGWGPEEDAALLKYYKQFHFLEDPIAYIADLLGSRASDIQRRLQELKVIGTEPTPAKGGSASSFAKILRNFIAAFSEEAIKVCAELHENISESMEMQRLGGAEAVCVVMEPLSASTTLLESSAFKAVMDSLGLSQDWLLPKDTSSLVPLLAVVGDPSNYIGEGHAVHAPKPSTVQKGVEASQTGTDDHQSMEPEPEDTSAPVVVTSRDIAHLLIDLMVTLEQHNENVSISSIIKSVITLVESASVIGNAESVCPDLPQNEECISRLRSLLRIADVDVRPPMIKCGGVTSEALVTDRLHAALNLSRLPLNRLETIAQRQPEEPMKLRPTSVITETDFEDSFEKVTESAYDDNHEEHLDFDAPITFNATQKVSKKTLRKGASRSSDTKKKMATKDDTSLDTTPTHKDVHGNELDAVLSELRRRLSSGELRIEAADIMGSGLFSNWDAAFASLRNTCRALGATEEFVDSGLWLVWSTDTVGSAVAQLAHKHGLGPVSHGRHAQRRSSTIRPQDIGVRCKSEQTTPEITPFRRLEIDRDRVAEIYEESLRLAREGRLQNTLQSKQDVQRLLD
ncbi:Uncharacterized protein BXIN_0756 [Babesia sp. Xinjiang]|uniref:Uncharacterized protein n=1 Tax=Babesia sp. Xinjiang TaxID=462227 RepID=UPI000A22636B|nr:Uncharacterized protein BXIN_0756 [Babesia sp. Xinjiang]ORM41363.1 Uncharacterized protein BXIN_0756 [Babesia sp. Xinjiang]